MTKRPEDAELGEVLGQPYTPPGRDAQFDIPSYDDIADLTVLFKRFANTAAAYNEASGGGLGKLINKTGDFTIDSDTIDNTFLCLCEDVLTVTAGDPSSFKEGDSFSVVQGSTGNVDIAGSVTGVSQTAVQFEVITAVVHDGQWWCFAQSQPTVTTVDAPLTYNESDHTLSVQTASSTQTGLRNITVSTSEPSGGSDGDVWIQL